MNVPTDLLSSIGICVGFAALIAAVTWRFRQPLIIAYLATGVIIGPIGLGFIKNQGSIATVAEIGLILLLFVIGLEIDIRKMASRSRSSSSPRWACRTRAGTTSCSISRRA